jgi:hypothetical protein
MKLSIYWKGCQLTNNAMKAISEELQKDISNAELYLAHLYNKLLRGAASHPNTPSVLFSAHPYETCMDMWAGIS